MDKRFILPIVNKKTNFPGDLALRLLNRTNPVVIDVTVRHPPDTYQYATNEKSIAGEAVVDKTEDYQKRFHIDSKDLKIIAIDTFGRTDPISYSNIKFLCECMAGSPEDPYYASFKRRLFVAMSVALHKQVAYQISHYCAQLQSRDADISYLPGW